MTLNDIIEELERNEDEPVPDSITIFPPENCNADITDEDSGDENIVTLHNLPGSQLRAHAEVINENSSSSDDDDEEHTVPLAQLAKRPRLEPSTSNTARQGVSTLYPSTVTTVPKNKTYTWRSRDTQPVHKTWSDMSSTKLKQTPLYFFDCLFNDVIIKMIVDYTNVYARIKNKVGNVTIQEMKCFIGILLYSGYVSVPRRYMYWENASDCGMPIIYNSISRDRFTFIMAHLHCCDNSNLDPNDKFAKVRPLFDMLNSNFVAYAPYEENHSIDEAMIPYYGGHTCKQYIRGKPIRWGYKFWVGATRLGYVIWFLPYQGKSVVDLTAYSKLGLGASIVLQYSDVLRKMDNQAPFHLFFDNFFTSITLIDELRERGFRATGTIRENRLSGCPLPKKKRLEKTERGTFKYKSAKDEEIVVCKWNDNKVVTVASNALKVTPTVKTRRFSQQLKRYIQIDQPAAIKAYNENMGGVDRSDQNIGLYRTSIRGKKWYFCLISHCLDMALHNAWQLYKINEGEYDHLKFRRSVATSLLETYGKGVERKPGRTSHNFQETSRFDDIGHIIKYRSEQLRCAICHKNAMFYCKKCKVSLHPKNCFELYHTASD